MRQLLARSMQALPDPDDDRYTNKLLRHRAGSKARLFRSPSSLHAPGIWREKWFRQLHAYKWLSAAPTPFRKASAIRNTLGLLGRLRLCGCNTGLRGRNDGLFVSPVLGGARGVAWAGSRFVDGSLHRVSPVWCYRVRNINASSVAKKQVAVAARRRLQPAHAWN